jgi:hypothetical protein
MDAPDSGSDEVAIPAEALEAQSVNRLGRLTILTVISTSKGLPKRVTNKSDRDRRAIARPAQVARKRVTDPE